MNHLCLNKVIYMWAIFFIIIGNVFPDDKVIIVRNGDRPPVERIYNSLGAGYERAVLVRLKLENISINSAKLQIAIAFPEIRVHKNPNFCALIKSVDAPYENELVCLPYLDGLKDKLIEFVNYIDNKNRDASQKRLDEILARITSYPEWVFIRPHTASFSSREDIFEDGPEEKKIFDKFHDEIAKAQKDFEYVINDKNNTQKFLAFAYLLKGWFYFKLSDYNNAIEMFDKVTGCGIADYSLSAALYKVVSLGLLTNDKSISILYDCFFYYRQCIEGRDFEFWASYYKNLPKSISAKKTATNIQNDYKYLEKDRKVILIWCKQITTGELEPMEQVKDDSKTDAPIKDEPKEPKQNTPK
ncbi:MAG: hypothetical protein WC980_01910 [Candidatus Brocadiia bacterium]